MAKSEPRNNSGEPLRPQNEAEEETESLDERLIERQARPSKQEIEDLESLKTLLAEEKAKAENYLANWQRAQADFTNYKRHCEQEREESARSANISLVRGILPILDDLERAFTHLPPEMNDDSWVDGLRMIDRKMRGTLEANGVTPIKALGEPFDPNLHEAVRQDKGKDGIVIEEVQKGYKIYDRVVRPAAVVVGNGEEGEKKEARHG